MDFRKVKVKLMHSVKWVFVLHPRNNGTSNRRLYLFSIFKKDYLELKNEGIN